VSRKQAKSGIDHANATRNQSRHLSWRSLPGGKSNLPTGSARRLRLCHWSLVIHQRCPYTERQRRFQIQPSVAVPAATLGQRPKNIANPARVAAPPGLLYLLRLRLIGGIPSANQPGCR